MFREQNKTSPLLKTPEKVFQNTKKIASIKIFALIICTDFYMYIYKFLADFFCFIGRMYHGYIKNAKQLYLPRQGLRLKVYVAFVKVKSLNTK